MDLRVSYTQRIVSTIVGYPEVKIDFRSLKAQKSSFRILDPK